MSCCRGVCCRAEAAAEIVDEVYNPDGMVDIGYFNPNKRHTAQRNAQRIGMAAASIAASTTASEYPVTHTAPVDYSWQAPPPAPAPAYVPEYYSYAEY